MGTHQLAPCSTVASTADYSLTKTELLRYRRDRLEPFSKIGRGFLQEPPRLQKLFGEVTWLDWTEARLSILLFSGSLTVIPRPRGGHHQISRPPQDDEPDPGEGGGGGGEAGRRRRRMRSRRRARREEYVFEVPEQDFHLEFQIRGSNWAALQWKKYIIVSKYANGREQVDTFDTANVRNYPRLKFSRVGCYHFESTSHL